MPCYVWKICFCSVNLIKQKTVLTSFSPLYFISSVMMLPVPILCFFKHSVEGLFSSNGSLYDLHWLYPPFYHYLLSLIMYFLSPCLPVSLFSHYSSSEYSYFHVYFLLYNVPLFIFSSHP